MEKELRDPSGLSKTGIAEGKNNSLCKKKVKNNTVFYTPGIRLTISPVNEGALGAFKNLVLM